MTKSVTELVRDLSSAGISFPENVKIPDQRRKTENPEDLVKNLWTPVRSLLETNAAQIEALNLFPDSLEISNIRKGIHREIDICLRSPDFNLLLEFFRDERFEQLTKDLDLSQNRMLDLHKGDSDFVKAIQDRRYDLAQAKKDSPETYHAELATFFGSQLQDGQVDKADLFEKMGEAFKLAWQFEDHMFSVIRQTLNEGKEDDDGEMDALLKSPYYDEIRAIADPLELLARMEDFYKNAKRVENEGNVQEKKEFLMAGFEAQKIYAWIQMFNLDQRSPERIRANGFDEYFRKTYLDKLFRRADVTEDTLESRVARLRDYYGIPVKDDGSLDVWFIADYDKKTGKTDFSWDWENSPEFQESPETATVYPRIYFDTEHQREVLCFSKTDIKKPRSTIEKEVRKQDRLKKDLNRMNLCFLTLEAKLSPVNQAVKRASPQLSMQEVQRIIERMIPIELMEENLREGVTGNKSSDSSYRSLSGVMKVAYGNMGDARLEIQVYPGISDYLVNESKKHPAGHKNYSHRRLITEVVPKAYPVKVYGEAVLKRVLNPYLDKYAREEITKFRKRTGTERDQK